MKTCKGCMVSADTAGGEDSRCFKVQEGRVSIPRPTQDGRVFHSFDAHAGSMLSAAET